MKATVHQDVAQYAQGLGTSSLIEETTEQDRDPSRTTGSLRPGGLGAAHKRWMVAFSLLYLRILAQELSNGSLFGRHIQYAHPLPRPSSHDIAPMSVRRMKLFPGRASNASAKVTG